MTVASEKTVRILERNREILQRSKDEDLIASKIAGGREQDLADVQAIKRAQQQKPKA